MTTPTQDQQIEFLKNLQRVLGEGKFTASHKFALLLALADLTIDDSGGALVISTNRIADKFIEYYWRQTLPYVTEVNDDGIVLDENTDGESSLNRSFVASNE